MLVLSRKPNEEILIGENIKITVLKVKGNTVRIGIEAPQSVKVMRGELPAQKTIRSEVELRQNESGEVELTLSFSPDQEGVSASSSASSTQERTASTDVGSSEAYAGEQPQVLRFKQPAKNGRKPLARTNGVAPSRSPANPAPATGTNRIKDILTRLASGLNADELTND